MRRFGDGRGESGVEPCFQAPSSRYKKESTVNFVCSDPALLTRGILVSGGHLLGRHMLCQGRACGKHVNDVHPGIECVFVAVALVSALVHRPLLPLG